MTILFVFGQLRSDRFAQDLSGPDVRPSPLAEYLLKTQLYNDYVRFTTVANLQDNPSLLDDHLAIYPVGMFMNYHKGFKYALMSDDQVGNTLRRKFAELAAIKGLYLLIDFSWEVATEGHLRALPEILKLANFPAHRLIYISSHSRLHLRTDFAYTHGSTLLGTWFFEFYVHEMHRHEFDVFRERGQRKRKARARGMRTTDRMFLCLNRRMRHHRLLIASFLWRQQLLTDGFLSFGGAEVEPEVDRFNDQIIEETKLLAADASLGQIITSSDINGFLELGPLTLDMEFKDKAMQHNSSKEFVDKVISTNDVIAGLYDRSLFSIVPETWFGQDNSDSFITEKTFKPILNCHPLILLGSPGILEDLSEIGYQTFDPVFDESYDRINDPARRFAAIAMTIERAIEALRERSASILPTMFDIAEHNQANFVEGTPDRVRQFLQTMEYAVRRSASYVFPETIPVESVLDQAGDFQGRIIAFEGALYCQLLAMTSPYVSWGEGFFEPERHGRGCWTGKRGTVTLRLGVGKWAVVFSTWAGGRNNAPKITSDEKLVRPRWVTKGDRDYAMFDVTLTHPNLTIDFESASTHIPEGQQRELGFWLFQEVLIAPYYSSVQAGFDDLPRNLLDDCLPASHGSVEQVAGDAYFVLNASRSSYVSFVGGFFGNEEQQGGRWCGPSGKLGVALSPGAWSIAFKFPTRNAPWIFFQNEPLSVDWLEAEGEHLARIRLIADESPVMLELQSRSPFVPAETTPDSTDKRILGFWLNNRLLVRPENSLKRAP